MLTIAGVIIIASADPDRVSSFNTTETAATPIVIASALDANVNVFVVIVATPGVTVRASALDESVRVFNVIDTTAGVIAVRFSAELESVNVSSVTVGTSGTSTPSPPICCG
jgi:hypothetical protein